MNFCTCPKCNVYVFKRDNLERLYCHLCNSIWQPPEKAPERINQSRAIEVFDQCVKQSGCGPWSDQLQLVLTDDEYDDIKKIWCDPANSGSASFSSTFLEIYNGRL